MKKICAVVVTYNRFELLTECLDALLAQTTPLSAILIIDNASTDGTQELLAKRRYLEHPKIEYFLMQSNLGGAGGFSEGIKIAQEKNFDWIWVMDDDAEPCMDSLEKLVPYMDQPGVIAVCPLVTDAHLKMEERAPHRGWFIKYKGDRLAKSATQEDIKEKRFLPIDHCSFVGLCFKSSILDSIGLPRGDFFIHYDDTEFSARLNKIGSMLLIPESKIKHKEAGKSGLLLKKTIFGKKFLRTDFQKLWIQYFGYRNKTWLIKNRVVNGSIGMLYLIHIKKLFSVLVFDDEKIRRIKFWNSAFFDGIRGDFNNERPKLIIGDK